MKHVFCILNNSKSNLETSKDSLLKVVDNKIISVGDISNLKDEDVFIADGGINFLEPSFLKNNKIFWFGDYDSIDDGFLLDEVCFYKEELNKDKDFSDFAGVLDYIVEQENKEDIFLEVYNALGGEKSHEYSNILEIRDFLKNLNSFSRTATVFIVPSIVITNRKLTLMVEKNRMFSVISLEDKKETLINIDGARYNGKVKLTRPSQGTRNVSISNIVEIDSYGDRVMIIVD